MGFISEDVLIQEILVCLPVKSLLRFKSVSKSWLSLIQTPFFVNLRTSFINSSSYSSSKFGETIILQTWEDCSEKYEKDIKLYMLSSSSGSDDDDDGDGDQKKKKFKVDDLGFLPFYKNYGLTDTFRMIGSCNGIICLHDPEAMDMSKGARRQHDTHLRDVCLWNPATRQFRILPKSIPIEEGKYGVDKPIQDFIDGEYIVGFVAFGFDVKTNDYKVLRITYFKPELHKDVEGCTCDVQVYSLSTNSWRLLEGINYLPVVLYLNNHGIYLNGSYFFVGERKPNSETCDSMKMVLSFDFTKEIFTTLQLPENDNNHDLVLSCMGDKLAVFTTRRSSSSSEQDGNDDSDGIGYEYFDIWVLNEQHCSILVNKESSWTKLHSLRLKTKIGQPYTYYSQPQCISNNGEFALISTRTDDTLQLFNLVTKEAEKDILIGSVMCRADVYKESLVSIMGGENDVLRWELPSHGTTYKLNLDATFDDSESIFGIGLCLTSDTGGCIAVRSLQRYVRDEEEGEAMAMLEAIKWAIKLELSPIIIESHSENCFSFLVDDDHDYSSTYWSSGAFSILKEAKVLLRNSSKLGIYLQYCYRNCNYVADDVAAKLRKEAMGNWFCMDWTANSLGEIVRSLSTDLGKET